MTGLDTNILLRYILQDDPVQSLKAEHLIESTFTQDDPGFISLVTMAEMVWVLGSVYHFTDKEIVLTIRNILNKEVVETQNEPEVYAAMIALQSGQADIADSLIANVGIWSGCTTTLTFDKRTSRLPGFLLL